MPRKAAVGGGKRVPLNMRTTRKTRSKLERAAALSGRSLAQEVEFRLEESFLKETFLSTVEDTLARWASDTVTTCAERIANRWYNERRVADAIKSG